MSSASIFRRQCWRSHSEGHQGQPSSKSTHRVFRLRLLNLTSSSQTLGVCHVPDQPRALAEVRRVLRQGGKFAMTVWCGPETSPCFAAVYRAIKAHGHPHVSVPSGPDFHQFARRAAAVELLADAGFSNIDVTTVDCVWDLNSPDELFEIYARGTVRVAMLLAKQPPQNLAAIRSALTILVEEQFSQGKRWRVPVPVALVLATA